MLEAILALLPFTSPKDPTPLEKARQRIVALCSTLDEYDTELRGTEDAPRLEWERELDPSRRTSG